MTSNRRAVESPLLHSDWTILCCSSGICKKEKSSLSEDEKEYRLGQADSEDGNE